MRPFFGAFAGCSLRVVSCRTDAADAGFGELVPARRSGTSYTLTCDIDEGFIFRADTGECVIVEDVAFGTANEGC